MTQNVSMFVAFGAGILSFLSPCILPLIPGYLSFISGAQTNEIKDGSKRGGILIRTLFFVLGFSIVFVALGLIFSGSNMMTSAKTSRIISIVAGVLISLLGLNIIFDFIKFLNTEAKAHVSKKPSNVFGSLLFGMAFGAGWTPCIGPILASILFMAGQSGSLTRAMILLMLYSLGLALPFIAAGLFFEKLTPMWAWFKKHGQAVKIVSGLLLIVLGLSIAFGQSTALNAFTVKAGMQLNDFIDNNPAGARLWSIAVLSVLALLIIIIPIIRKKLPLKPIRLVILSVIVLLIIFELSNIVSIPSIIGKWLLFQGI